MKKIFIIIVFSLLLTACAQSRPVYPANNNNGQPAGGVVCTKDARLCPDGTAVGRVGPNCEFAPCPTANNAPGGQPNPTVCTMEAKLCPDGSYVGRSGPNCEFAPCPANNNY